MAPGAMNDGSKVEIEEERCGLDMGSYEDLPPKSVGGDCNGDGKDDYVFVNGSDAGSEDHGEAGGNGRLDTSELDVHSHKEANGDGQSEVYTGDVALDDPGEKGGVGELNLSGSSVDTSEEAEGGAADRNVSDSSEVDNGHGDKVDGEIKADGQVLELGDGDGVDGERENEDEVEGGELVKENGQVNQETETVDEDVEVRDSEVERSHTNIVPGVVEERRDNCNPSVDDKTTFLLDDDDDKVKVSLGTDKVLDTASPDKDEVHNGAAVVGAGPLVSDRDSEPQHLMEPKRDEDHGNPPVVEDGFQPHADEVVDGEIEPLVSDVEDLKPSEGDVECQPLEVGISETQSLDAEVKTSHLPASSEPHSLDADCIEPLVDDAINENKSSDGQQPESLPGDEGNEFAPSEAEAAAKEQGDLDASTADVKQDSADAGRFDVNQSEECEVKVQNSDDLTTKSHEIQEMQTDSLQSKGKESKSDEPAPKEAENKVTEQGDVDSSDTAINQELDSLNSEVVTRELNPSEERENAPELTVEEKELKKPQSDSLLSEVVEKQSTIESTASSVEGSVSDITSHVEDSKAESIAEVDVETEKVDVKGKSDLAAKVLGNQEFPVGADVIDQVTEENGSVNVTDKEIFLKDLDSEKTAVVEETTSLSEIQAANGTAVDENRSDLGTVCISEKVSDNLANDSQTVPVSCETSNDAEGGIKYKGSHLSVPVDTAAGFPGSPEVDTIKEQVVENADSTADINTSAADTLPQATVKIGNEPLPNHVHDTNPEITAANGEIDGTTWSACISSDTLKSKISFGSFVCEASFSANDVSMRPEVSDRSIELTCGQPNVNVKNSECNIKPSNGVPIQNAEANGVQPIRLNHDKICPEVSSAEHVKTDEVSALPLEGPGGGALKGQNTDLVRRPFYYLIRVPRYDDEKLKEQIRLSELQVEEKTRTRDAVRVEYQQRKGAIIQVKSVLEDAKSEERAARELVRAKKREIDSSQSLVNLAKNAITVEDVQAQILNMEHKIQHETLHLKEEKQLVREIKQMKNLKDQLYGNAQKQEEIKQALDQKEQVEEHLKVLKKELASLRDNLSKAEESVKVAKKRYDEESASLNELYIKFKSADTVRQDAYAHLVDLRKQWSEKNKHFRSYKDDARAANDFAAVGDMGSLERHCVDQVGKFMELWNKNDEFRKEYIKCNTRSTLRRLRTLDGRALGPDEEPPSFGNVSDDRVTMSAKVNSVPAVATVERDLPVATEHVDAIPLKKVVEQKNKPVSAKKMVEVASKNSSAEASGRTETEEDKEERKPTKEEEELARKAEQQKKEEEEARLREQRREEEKAKAQEALERKKRMAEKAKARAEFRARKEAEEKEKERERRSKKKEKQRGFTSEPAESEPAVRVESSSETTREPEVTEKPVTVAKKPQKPSPYAKQIKSTKSIPPPLRNRGKRRMQQWMWALATVVAILALFFLGNSNFLRNNSLLGFGPSY